MLVLEKELKNTEMQNLVAFNHTYLIITRNVAEKLGKNYFNNDELMEKFDIHFSRYYFDALYNYVHEEACPPSWKILFNLCKKDNLYQFMYMALGVNAHVNNDLGLTIFDIVKDDSYKKDYDKVNIIIKKSIKEVVNFLEEKSRPLNSAKNSFQPVYSYFLYKIIQKWRHNAWENYTMLKAQSVRKTDIEKKAEKTAGKLTKIRSYLQFYAL
jgi:hypothetical protein